MGGAGGRGGLVALSLWAPLPAPKDIKPQAPQAAQAPAIEAATPLVPSAPDGVIPRHDRVTPPQVTPSDTTAPVDVTSALMDQRVEALLTAPEVAKVTPIAPQTVEVSGEEPVSLNPQAELVVTPQVPDQLAIVTVPARRAEEGALLRPVERFAQPFEGTFDKPVMGLILVDDGSLALDGPQGLVALQAFPAPLSIAMDMSRPGDMDRMARFREAGFDVFALMALEAEIESASVAAAMREAVAPELQIVGVLESHVNGFQNTRSISDAVLAVLAKSGHGLVTQSAPLNIMPNLARKQGIPAGAVFRVIDDSGRADTVRRAMDTAVSRSVREDSVIVQGRLHQKTIAALLLWILQDRAALVELVPVSAILLNDQKP